MLATLPQLTKEEQELLNEVISEQFGLWFPEHKHSILAARLAPRLRALHLKRFLDYYLHLQCDLNGEREHLARIVTNNETYFFRETRQFDALFGSTLQELLQTSFVPKTLRCLSAGCSSGEEPYTLNVYAHENRHKLAGAGVEIHAFDIDRDRLELAHRAEYGPSSLRALTDDRAHCYFSQPEAGRFLLRPTYQRGVRFAEGNIIQRRSFQQSLPYDVVFCRNVLIYFSEAALHQAIDNFAAVLRPGGLLFLGHAESIIGVSRFFETVRLETCIAYRRVAGAESR
jgi:chemotaxis protein methyltransferase CheR